MAFLWANLPALSNAQQVDTETGNVVYTTVNPPPAGTTFNWGGFVTTQSNGGGFSGGNVPGYNASTGTFIFGYMQGTVNYSLAINTAMQAAGTGIQVNGFRYSWQYFNQDYSRGILTGNINLTNSSGAVVESYNYLMPKTTEGWTTMSGIQNFNTQYAPPSLGNLNVSFTGKDDRFWAGYYGPQIKDIDVRLLYSSNAQPPTDSNPACTAYSTEPKCLTQNFVSPTSTGTTTSTPTTTTTSSESLTSPLSLTHVTSSVPNVTESAPTHVVSHTTPVVATTPPVASTTSSAPPASAPTRVGEVSDSAKSAQPAVSLSTILSIVSNEQSRIGSVERNVVQQAVEQATKEAEKTQREAEKIAGDSQQHSITASMNSTTQTHSTSMGTQPTTFINTNPGAPQNQSMGSAHAAGPMPGVQGPIVSFFSSGTESGIGISAFRQEQNNAQGRLTAPVVVAAVPQVSYSLLPPSRSQQLIEIDLPRAEPTRFGARPMIEEIGRSMPSLPQSSTQSNQTDTVKRNVPNNELAGAVDIASIATQPRGYAQYNVGMPDSAFYEPKEIYRNQRTVDNARVLRGLMSGSDRLHQEMVNQQYK